MKPELIKYSVTAERTRLMYLDLCSRGDPMRTTMKVFLNVLTVFAKNSGNYNKRNSIFTQDQRQQVHQLVELAVKQVAPRLGHYLILILSPFSMWWGPRKSKDIPRFELKSCT